MPRNIAQRDVAVQLLLGGGCRSSGRGFCGEWGYDAFHGERFTDGGIVAGTVQIEQLDVRRVSLQNGQRRLACGAPVDAIHVLLHLMGDDGLIDVPDVPDIHQIVDETGQQSAVGGDAQTVHRPSAARIYNWIAFWKNN